jgi:dimethylargininase
MRALTFMYGAQSMVAPLKRVMVRRPDLGFDVGANYKKWNYNLPPNLPVAQAEHDNFVSILRQQAVDVVYHQHPLPHLADSIFVHDPVLITNSGAVILRMGKKLRLGEEDAIEAKLRSMNVPILARLNGNATAEAGDMLWLDPETLIIGRGYRTNGQGIAQVRAALKSTAVKIWEVDLPHDKGPAACLHLQSIISLVSHDTAVVYKKYLAVSFIEFLQAKGFNLIDVTDSEYASMATNILAIAPKLLLTLEGNNETKQKLEDIGCRVLTYKGKELSLNAEGGPTCLTRPLLRLT